MFARVEPGCEDVGSAHLYMRFTTSNYKFKHIFPYDLTEVNTFFPSISSYFTEVNPAPLTFAKVGLDAALAALMDAEMLCEL